MSKKAIEVLKVLATKLDTIREIKCEDGDIKEVYYTSGIVKALEMVEFLIDSLVAENKGQL